MWFANLWYKNKDACFASINDITYGINAGAIVVSVEVTMLYKLVLLNVPLHLLP